MKAPLFTALDQSKQEINIKDYLGKYVVLYFFPKAFTPGWTKEACGFRDKYSIFKENNISIIGVSYDSYVKLNNFKKKHNIPFTFISDTDKKISKLYNSNGFFFPSRKTIIIDPLGNIKYIFKDVSIDSHPEDILKMILNDKILEK